MVEGPRIKRELSKQNIESKFIRGLRVTDDKIIKIVETVLIEILTIIEKEFFKKKDLKQCQSIQKRYNVIEVIPEQNELGFVGIPKKINADIINEKLKKIRDTYNFSTGLGNNNQTYNINGDHAAGAVAKSLKSRRLFNDKRGGCLKQRKKLISEINSSKIIEMINDKTITEGMIPKINTCLDAVKNDVTAVGIIDGRKPRSILFELFSDKGSEYLIRK